MTLITNLDKSQIIDKDCLFDRTIQLNHFRMEGELGKGSYAIVKLGVNKKTNKKYALKIY